jgi:hypothetical protein
MDAVKVPRPQDWASRGDDLGVKHRNTFCTFCRCHRGSARFDKQPEQLPWRALLLAAHWKLRWDRQYGPMWLHLEGSEGIKDFILDEFGLR